MAARTTIPRSVTSLPTTPAACSGFLSVSVGAIFTERLPGGAPRPGRKSRRPWAVILLPMILLVLLPLAVIPASSAHGQGSTPAPETIEIVETHPIETSLGHPATRETRDVWIELIDNARSTLDLEQFYVSTWPGESLQPVLDAIGRAAARGVSVRLLIDAGMHRTYPQPADSLGDLPGVELRTIDYRQLAGGVQHSKFIVVDLSTAFVGSQNFDWRALEHIHELGLVVHDARVARTLGKVFEIDWLAAADSTSASKAGSASVPGAESLSVPYGAPAPSPVWDIALAPGDTARVRLSASPPPLLPDSLGPDREALIRLIDGSRHELVAQMLTYSVRSRGLEDASLDAALRRAAERGVHVRFLVSDWQADGDRMAAVQSLAAVPGIEVGMSVVPEWSGGYIPFARVEHCKFLVADSLHTWIGTSNWGPDYFAASRNVAVSIEHPGIARIARETFEISWSSPLIRHVHPDSTYSPRAHGEEPPAGHRRSRGE